MGCREMNLFFRKWRKKFLFLFFVGSLTMVFRNAFGEIKLNLPPLKDEKERGLKAGEFIIKPILQIEGKYDTNLFREDYRETPNSTPMLRILPGFSILNPRSNLLKFRFSGIGEIRQYISDNPNIKEQSRIGGVGDLTFEIIPKYHIGFKIYDKFKRELQTRNYSSVDNYDKIINKAGALLSLVPGRGALKIDFEYAFNFDMFDDFDWGNYYYHEGKFLTSWKIFPKTLFFIESIFRLYNYKKTGGDLQNYNSKPLRIYGGMNGYITKKLSLFWKGGYANSFYEKGTNFEGFVGEFSVGFKPSFTTIFSAGYIRNFEDSYFANYYTTHSAYAKVQQQLFRKLNFEIKFKYDYVEYSTFNPSVQNVTFSTTNRKDHGINAEALLEFSIARFIGIFAGYRLDIISTDFYTITSGIPDYGGYKKHEIFGGLKLLY